MKKFCSFFLVVILLVGMTTVGSGCRHGGAVATALVAGGAGLLIGSVLTANTNSNRNRCYYGSSEYERAYAREQYFIEQERYRSWVRAERERGRIDAQRDAGYCR